MLLNLFYLLAIFVPIVMCDQYTSVQHLHKLFSYEKLGVRALNKYVQKTEKHLKLIRSYLHDFPEVLNEMSNETTTVTLGSKLHSEHVPEARKMVKLIQNISRNFETFSPSSISEEKKAFLNIFEGNSSKELLPNPMDYQGSIAAILRLQLVYQFLPSDLANGNVFGLQTNAELTSFDCINIAKLSLSERRYELTLQWLKEADRLLIKEDQRPEILEANRKHIQSMEAGLKNINSRTAEVMKKIKAKNLKKNIKFGEGFNMFHLQKHYQDLCRGDEILNKTYLSTLYCYYDNRGSPYLTLMPVKIEVFYHQPWIVMFHDIVNRKENFMLKELAKPYLSRAQVSAGGGAPSDKRTAQNYFLPINMERKYFNKLNHRVSYITGLKTDEKSAETFQVANYGVGGHYYPHFDFITDSMNLQPVGNTQRDYFDYSGDRIATLMLYLTNVERGGATVFPKLGVTLWPVKNAAAFWYNIKDSGELDRDTIHGGCPVLFGSKWVVNKWIRERNQFRTRPCKLF